MPNRHNPHTHQRRCLPALFRATVALGALGPVAVQAADHVVIMTISAYPSAPLAGVVYDSRNALQLAEHLGYDTRNPTILKDQQLTAPGLRAALAQLAARVQMNDRVFFYYSGHGTSSRVGNQCVSALVAHDETFIPTDELKTYFDQLKGKVQDAFIVMDACFSGGHQALAQAGARSSGNTGTAPASPTAKAWRPAASDVCDQPTNMAKAWQLPAPAVRGLGRMPENNFSFVAAASERQVALDDPTRGGLATISLLRCAADGVPAPGLATPSLWAACAQQRVNTEVPTLNARYGSRWAAHTLEVAGNTERPLTTLKTRPSPPTNATNANSANAASQAAQATAALRQLASSGSNGNWAFRVTPSASTIRLSDAFAQRVVRFPYTSSQPGYGYVLYVGTDGKDMKQLFPEPGENNFLPAQGEFPPLSIDPPAGDNTYVFLVSQTPQNFSYIFQAPSGQASAQATALQCELSSQRNSGRVAWGNACDTHRNSGRVQPPSAAGLQGYAAQLLVVSGR